MYDFAGGVEEGSEDCIDEKRKMPSAFWKISKHHKKHYLGDVLLLSNAGDLSVF